MTLTILDGPISYIVNLDVNKLFTLFVRQVFSNIALEDAPLSPLCLHWPARLVLGRVKTMQFIGVKEVECFV